MIRVILADDHIIFRQGLSRLLQAADDISIEGECGNGRDALELIRRTRPDVAILDLSMPHMDGIEVSRMVQKEGLNTKVLLLTMHKDPALAKRAVRTGISGYVLKDCAFDELLDSIRRVASGGLFVSPSVQEKMPHTEDKGHPILSAKEKDILRWMAHGKGNWEIANILGITVSTVKFHVGNIMKKLDAVNRAQAVAVATQKGLIEIE